MKLQETTFIIPAYGPDEIVERAVSSIAAQWLGKEYVNLIIVNDHSPHSDYKQLADRYRHRIKSIEIIMTPQNSGQGVARQTGIDACTTETFFLCDEDDMYSPIAFYTFMDAYLHSMYKFDPSNGELEKDENGNFIMQDDAIPVAVVAGPLEQCAPMAMCKITNGNNLWLNSKLYCKKFLTDHGIRFNPLSSRHSEDYQMMQDFFFCLDMDEKWTGILIDDSKELYYWLENENSQSRKDPFYGQMLSGYTARSSVLGLQFMKHCEEHGVTWNEEVKHRYLDKLINNTAYNYFCIYNFIYAVISKGYVPALEQDWTILRDACKDLTAMVRDDWNEFTYTRRAEEIFKCKNLSDCRTDGYEPFVDFDTFIRNGDIVLEWSFEDLMKAKEIYKIDDKGNFVKQ